MNLDTFLIETETTQQDFAAAIGVSQSLVHQWARGVALPPPARCVQIERHTAGRVTRADLRPDDWRSIWPELTWPAAWDGCGTGARPRAAVSESVPDGAQGPGAVPQAVSAGISASAGTSVSPGFAVVRRV